MTSHHRRHPVASGFLAAGLAFAAAATLPAAARRDWQAATPSGKPVDCVQIVGIDHTDVHDDRTIDFVMRDRTVFRNTLPHACPELGFEESFTYETSLSQLCSVDLITVLHRGGPPIRGATCGLGTFQPVTLPAR